MRATFIINIVGGCGGKSKEKSLGTYSHYNETLIEQGAVKETIEYLQKKLREPKFRDVVGIRFQWYIKINNSEESNSTSYTNNIQVLTENLMQVVGYFNNCIREVTIN